MVSHGKVIGNGESGLLVELPGTEKKIEVFGAIPGRIAPDGRVILNGIDVETTTKDGHTVGIAVENIIRGEIREKLVNGNHNVYYGKNIAPIETLGVPYWARREGLNVPVIITEKRRGRSDLGFFVDTTLGNTSLAVVNPILLDYKRANDMSPGVLVCVVGYGDRFQDVIQPLQAAAENENCGNKWYYDPNLRRETGGIDVRIAQLRDPTDLPRILRNSLEKYTLQKGTQKQGTDAKPHDGILMLNVKERDLVEVGRETRWDLAGRTAEVFARSAASPAFAEATREFYLTKS